MANTSFYPGPSRVYSNITEYLYEAYKDGYMSINHRSEEFMFLSKKTKKVLRKKLSIPEDYRILFVSSATECWEIIAQSLIQASSQHFYSGAFGEKWAGYTSAIVKKTKEVPFDINDDLPANKISSDFDTLCFVHTETSNGTFLNREVVKAISKKRNSEQLVAFDATSSIGGLDLPWKLGDVWFASVQKCLGLPAGLGLMILSPRAVARAEQLGDKKRYNSLLRILENDEKNQTHFTPNVLNIYLLMRTQDFSRGIAVVEDKILKRFAFWNDFFSSFNQFDFLVEDKKNRAPTVFTIKTKDPNHWKSLASSAGLTIGNGYGPWKDTTFRVANFPAIKRKEIEALTKLFQKSVL